MKLLAPKIRVRLRKNAQEDRRSKLDDYSVACLLEQKSDQQWEVTVQIYGTCTSNFEEKKLFPAHRVKTPADDLEAAKSEAAKLVAELSRKYHKLSSGDHVHVWSIDWEDGSKFSFR